MAETGNAHQSMKESKLLTASMLALPQQGPYQWITNKVTRAATKKCCLTHAFLGMPAA
jgi:hypothetical protein